MSGDTKMKIDLTLPFQKYQSKPVERTAYEITGNEDIEHQGAGAAVAKLEVGDMTINVVFSATQYIKVGDFIVYLNDNDIYHCPRDVFLDRNEYPAK